MVGFEPTLPEGIWFRVRRLNHSATSASCYDIGSTQKRIAVDLCHFRKQFSENLQYCYEFKYGVAY